MSIDLMKFKNESDEVMIKVEMVKGKWFQYVFSSSVLTLITKDIGEIDPNDYHITVESITFDGEKKKITVKSDWTLIDQKEIRNQIGLAQDFEQFKKDNH